MLGTVGYMAPEQVRGAAADYRADLFAFGAVLYEMVTGVRAFSRETAAETMTAILREDPPEPPARARHLAAGRSHHPALPGEETGGALPIGARFGVRARCDFRIPGFVVDLGHHARASRYGRDG